MQNAIAYLIVALAANAFASASLASEFITFKSPTGNISCLYSDEGEGYLRCDIREFNRSKASRPRDCDLEWGDAFEITRRSGKGEIACHGDTVFSDAAAALGYGESWTKGELSCQSAQKGFTCHNALGHGFFLSRREQRVF